MVALGFFDVEAHLVDPLLDIEIKHFLGYGHAGRRQYRDHVKGNLTLAQQADARDRPVESSFARAGQTVAIMKLSGAVDAHPEIDMLVGKKCAPSLVDQRPVRLKRMGHRYIRGPEPVDHLERVAVERDWQDHRLAGMPDDR